MLPSVAVVRQAHVDVTGTALELRWTGVDGHPPPVSPRRVRKVFRTLGEGYPFWVGVVDGHPFQGGCPRVSPVVPPL